MAVVESAADGLSLSVPALGLPIPLQFPHLSPDPDLDPPQPPRDLFLLRHHVHSHASHPSPPPHFDHNQNPASFPHTQDASPHSPPISHDRIDAAIGAAETTPDSADSATPSDQSIALVSAESANAENKENLSAEGITSTFHDGKRSSESSANADTQKQFARDDIRELEELLSKLNPLAKEFVPSSILASELLANGAGRKKKNNHSMGRRRTNGRTSKAQLEECVRRTVYVCDIDQQVTEEQLAALFLTCGHVVDCRVCGDPNSVLRFAFVEFTDEEGANAALGLSGTMLGFYPVRVLPSKTAIVPVNPSFLPRSENEREMCARTVYCTNIDKKVSQADVKLFFESLCGEVARLRLLGDYRHSTRIAFVEFVRAESAMSALNCSGAILGSLPLRVSPSKTPVRPRSPRLVLQSAQ